MNTNKLKKKLEDFFSSPKKKQKRKHNKFLKIIKKLESKKSKIEIEIEMTEEGQRDETGDRYHELSHELDVVTRLINKANELVRSSQSFPTSNLAAPVSNE